MARGYEASSDSSHLGYGPFSTYLNETRDNVEFRARTTINLDTSGVSRIPFAALVLVRNPNYGQSVVQAF